MQFTTKTTADAFKAVGKEQIVFPSLPGLPEESRKHLEDYYNLTVVVEAINQEANDGKPWEPNWNDEEEEKYRLWFGIKADAERPSGFGFSRTLTLYDRTHSAVGSRLCFKTEAAADYAAEQFEQLFVAVYLKLKS